MLVPFTYPHLILSTSFWNIFLPWLLWPCALCFCCWVFFQGSLQGLLLLLTCGCQLLNINVFLYLHTLYRLPESAHSFPWHQFYLNVDLKSKAQALPLKFHMYIYHPPLLASSGPQNEAPLPPAISLNRGSTSPHPQGRHHGSVLIISSSFLSFSNRFSYPVYFNSAISLDWQ